MRGVLSLAVALFLLLPFCAQAQSGGGQKSLGTFGEWRTFSYKEKKDPVCYMVRPVTYDKNAKLKRGQSYLMITHRPGESSKDVFSFTAGYNFKPTSDVKISIGDRKFSLFTENDTAWARGTSVDHALAKAIRGADTLIVTGTPTNKIKGGIVTDKIMLKGSSAAYAAISKACHIDVEPLTKPAAKAEPTKTKAKKDVKTKAKPAAKKPATK